MQEDRTEPSKEGTGWNWYILSGDLRDLGRWSSRESSERVKQPTTKPKTRRSVQAASVDAEVKSRRRRREQNRKPKHVIQANANERL
mmetsp:Transcript_48640/g.103980  ORF Transcript_48640/g.103980 Transcript_48640/m.103980 type:complete len:87 (-) Transcript_48640:86-346(-)